MNFWTWDRQNKVIWHRQCQSNDQIRKFMISRNRLIIYTKEKPHLEKILDHQQRKVWNTNPFQHSFHPNKPHPNFSPQQTLTLISPSANFNPHAYLILNHISPHQTLTRSYLTLTQLSSHPNFTSLLFNRDPIFTPTQCQLTLILPWIYSTPISPHHNLTLAFTLI